MKISVSSYSFSQLLQKKLHTQFSLIALAGSLGFDGIEFTDLTPPEGMSESEYAALLRREAERCQIAVTAYTVGANLLAADPEAEYERLCRKVDVAKELGAPLMRHDAYFAFPEGDENPTFEKYLDRCVSLFRRVTEYAEKQGIRTCTENHGRLCQDPERVEAFIKGVNHPNFGWLLDVGNFLCADCDPLRSVEIGAGYAFHVHAKDFVYLPDDSHGGFKTRAGRRLAGTTIGTGVVPVRECIQKILASGYRGYVTVEYEGSAPVLEEMPKSIAFLREIGG